VGAPEPILLQPQDLAILALESQTVAGHACKVVLVGDGAPGLAELRSAIGRRIAGAPELTRRLGEVGGAPAWVPDERFDLAAQVVACPTAGPLDDAGLRREVARLFAERLDRSRPLWRIDVAPLQGERQALVWRTHHALADGTTAMRLARAILWDPRPEPAAATDPPGATAAADDARRRGHLLGFMRREIGPPGHPSPFDGRIGTRRQVAFAAIPLGPLRDAARSACAATVNDAVLTVVAGGIRRWLEAHHGRLGTIRVRVPVSLHHEGDDPGNSDSFFSLGVPLDEPDPVARLRAVREATAARKADDDARTQDELMRGLARRSPTLRALAARLQASPRGFAVAVSNIVGPRAPVAVLGAPVGGVYSLAEIGQRHALRVGVVSLAGTLGLGLCADPGIVDDLQAMAEGAEAEARALIEAA
jgi:diacylglycerol O-acyltransferase / wax synthase